jgi:hypothetical protein
VCNGILCEHVFGCNVIGWCLSVLLNCNHFSLIFLFWCGVPSGDFKLKKFLGIQFGEEHHFLMSHTHIQNHSNVISSKNNMNTIQHSLVQKDSLSRNMQMKTYILQIIHLY